jgi:hypothetical protein
VVAVPTTRNQPGDPTGDVNDDEREVRGWDKVLADAVAVLNEAARLRRPGGTDPVATGARTERVDFAEFVSLALAAAAANVGGIDELLAGRPGSWEAAYVRDLVTSTVGHDEQYLWQHRTEPLAIEVHVDQILSELGISELFAESARELWRPQDALRDARTEAAEAELDRLAQMEDDLQTLMDREWAAYGEAFKHSVLAELEREPLPGLGVPIEFDIDVRTWQPLAPSDDPVLGPLARLYDAGWLNSPLPGSGVAPKDYPPGVEVAQVERDAGRLPHLRLPGRTDTGPEQVPDRGEWRGDRR